MFEFELPDLGEGVAGGEVLGWHVAVGDSVEEGQVLAEVETDKAAVDVPSPVDGVVRELHADVGDVVATGEVLVSIEESEAPTDGESATDFEPAGGDGTTGDGRIFAPPSVRRLARERGVDISAVEGSGPSGRITESDVQAATDEPTSVVSRVDDEDGDGPTTVVSKVDDSDDEPTSVVSRVDSGDEQGPGSDEPVVKSAVRRVTGTMTERRDHTLATPSTRRLARELGVDIDAVPTDETRDGEPYVDAAAVRAVASAERSSAEPASSAERSSADQSSGQSPRDDGGTASERREEASEITDEDVREVAERVVSELRETAEGVEPTPVEASEADRREPYQGVRRTIGERLARSRREVPHATHHDMVAVPGLVEARERLQPLAEERGIRLTYTPLLLRCVAAALDDHPILATQLDTESEEIVYRSDRAIGVATATDHGLVVPVVEGVDEKGLLELAGELDDLIERARSRDIGREEMQGGVFTVTNFGAIGGEYADPIINVPETAILGVGALRKRPVVEDGESRNTSEQAGSDVVAKPTLTLSLSVDHRVIDRTDAARFVNTLKSYLSDPTRLLLD